MQKVIDFLAKHGDEKTRGLVYSSHDWFLNHSAPQVLMTIAEFEIQASLLDEGRFKQAGGIDK